MRDEAERSQRRETQLQEQVSSAMKEHISLVTKEFEERKARFEALFDRIFRHQLGKEIALERGGSPSKSEGSPSKSDKGILEIPSRVMSVPKPRVNSVPVVPIHEERPETLQRERFLSIP